MLMFKIVWLLGAAVVALGILLDLRRLIAGRIRASWVAWVVVGAFSGPIACAIYLFIRRRVRRKLVHAVWQIVGDELHPTRVRRQRLITLRDCGLVGPTIFRVCLKALARGGSGAGP
jgi:hypothetical protein